MATIIRMPQPKASQPDLDHDSVVSDQPRDRIVWCVAIVATLISVAATTHYYKQGLLLSYFDSTAHLAISKRFIQGGFGQLGGVWLPLPHILTAPFVWLDSLYYSGLAGSVISMTSYVITAVYLYKITLGLTHSRVAALAAAAVFALNPNVLYMQATPMTEMLLFACMAAMVYYTQRWIQTGQRYGYLLFGVTPAAVAGALTRYEAWVLVSALLGVMVVVSYRRYGYARAEGTGVTFFITTWLLSIGGWIGWNWLMFGNGLNWQNGEYAKSSLWVGADELAPGNWKLSALTYWYATVNNFGLVIIVVAAVGIVALIVRRRNLDILPVLSLLTLVPFFIFALWAGQRPMHVMEVSKDLYNVRFALMMSLPAAVGVGYLVSCFGKYVRLALVVAAVSGMIFTISTTSRPVLAAEPMAWRDTAPVLVEEPKAWLASEKQQQFAAAAKFLRAEYDDGVILASFFGNESILFDAHIDLSHNIYEGTYKVWEKALADPESERVKWILMRNEDQSDPVYKELFNAAALTNYTLVYDQVGYKIYERR